jgi:hypothetical protein
MQFPSKHKQQNKKVMTYENEQKAKAALKIAMGAGRVGSGVALALGHGLLAAALRTPSLRMPAARCLIQSGQETFKEGMAEWNK